MSMIGRSDHYWWSGNREEVRVSREQLHDFAWSAPIRQLAGELGVSDVGLAKALRQNGIPLPPQGHWNKIQAGKPTKRVPLACRQPGQDGLLPVHGSLADRFRPDAAAEENPDGPFSTDAVPEDLEELRQLILAKVGKLTVPRKLDETHRALHALLRRDDGRREKIANATYPTWERAPVFDQPQEQRKLRIVNTLMIALERMGYRCDLYGQHEPSFRAKIGDHDVHVTIQHPGEPIAADRRHGDQAVAPAKTPLQIELSARLPNEIPRLWVDRDNRLEGMVAEIVASIVTAGEARYRLSIAERLQRIAEREARREEQRQAALATRNKERLEALHRSAELLRAAQDLRALIASVSTAIELGHRDLDQIAFAEWRQWAAAEADRIDPVISGQVNEHLVLKPLAEQRVW